MANKISVEYIKIKNSLLKERSSKMLIWFLIFFISGYTFFFSSKAIFDEKYSDEETVKLLEEKNIDNRIFTIRYWAFSKDKRDMIAVIDVDNLNLDNENRYRWEIRDQNGTKQTKILLETDSRVIIYAKDIKKDFKNISIRCRSKKSSFEEVRLLSSRKEIEIVDSFDKTYILNNTKEVLIDEEILINRRKVLQLEKDIEHLDKKIKTAEEKIKEVEAVLEDSESDTNTSAIAIKKSSFEDEKSEKVKEIEILKKKIEKLENIKERREDG